MNSAGKAFGFLIFVLGVLVLILIVLAAALEQVGFRGIQ